MPTPLQQRWTALAACAVLVFALLPFLVTFMPRIYFDVDPLSPAGQAPITALGPAASAWLCVAASVLGALVLGLCVWMKRPVAWWAVALVAVGVVVQLVHLRPARPDNLWYGPAWIAGSLLALAAYHLGQLPGGRRWIVAGFVAILVPVTLDSVYFVFVEHPNTVASYQQGVTGGAPSEVAAESYERRLRATDAIGAFSLSNVLGSLTMAGTLLAASGMLAMRDRRAKLVAAACATAGLVTVYLTNSKGALAALLAGAVLLAVAPWARRGRGLPAALCVGAIVAAVAGILVVASMGVPRHGEGGARVSLLFRYHYWQGAAAQVAESPFLGMGQEGFRDAYLRTKNPVSPEDVRSSHNVFVDWIAMLGVGGWAWSALAMTWLVTLALDSRGRQPAREGDGDASELQPAGMNGKALWLPCAATGAVLFFTQYAVEFDLLMIDTALIWLAGLIGFVVVMAHVAGTAWSERWTWAGLLAAATALLAHNQIEMTFHHAPSALPAWVLLGAAASLGAQEAKRRRFDALAVLLPLATAVALLVLAAAPLSAQQPHLARAAAALRGGWGESALRELDAAAVAIPADPVTLRWRVTMRLQYADAMERGGHAREARALREATLSLCSPAAFGGVESYRLARLRAEVRLLLGETEAAVAELRRVVEDVPYGVNDWLRLGDVLAMNDRVDEAIEAYRHLLEVDALRALDPATQLRDADRARVEAYLKQHGA